MVRIQSKSVKVNSDEHANPSQKVIDELVAVNEENQRLYFDLQKKNEMINILKLEIENKERWFNQRISQLSNEKSNVHEELKCLQVSEADLKFQMINYTNKINDLEKRLSSVSEQFQLAKSEIELLKATNENHVKNSQQKNDGLRAQINLLRQSISILSIRHEHQMLQY